MIVKEMGSRVSTKRLIGVLGLALAVSACGGQVKMGAAATFSDSRITTSSLDDQVNTWTKEFAKTPEAGQARQQVEGQSQGSSLPYDPTSPTRTLLNWLIDFRVWDEVAVEQGITVTPAQVDNAIQAKGGQRWLDLATVALGMPRSDGPSYMRMYVIQQNVQQQIGVPSTTQGQQQLTQEQVTALEKQFASIYQQAIKTVDVKVNPRYGTFPLVPNGQPTYALSKADPALNGSAALGS